MIKWTDSGYLIQKKQLKESGHIFVFLTEHHGVYSGYGRMARSSKKPSTHQLGSLFHLHWTSRVENNLGFWKFEPLSSVLSSLYTLPGRLDALMNICNLISLCFLERESHSTIFHYFTKYLLDLKTEDWLRAYCLCEVFLLQELGFGLDLTKCTVTGDTKNLIYVSPKTGRAACEKAGAPYAEKLLPLPQFLIDSSIVPTQKTLIQSLDLTWHFFTHHIFNKPYPLLYEQRMRLIQFTKKVN